jgi:hypothetical protein
MSVTVQTIPLTTTMAAATPYLPSTLVDNPARAALHGITDRLPAALTRRAYLECRLAARAPRVDLVFCVDASSRRLLMGPQRKWLPDHLRAHPLWVGLERLCAHWADPASRVGASIYDLWLEFDTASPPPAGDVLVPSVFVGMARTIHTTARETWRGGRRTLETLLNRSLDPRLLAAMRPVVDRLPAGVSLNYVGVMYPRSPTALRLCVSPLAGAPLLDYLRAIAWPGDVDALAAFLRAIPRGAGTTAFDAVTLLHLDVEDGVLPRIGLELPLPQYPLPIDAQPEREYFETLCARGLCARAKRDALARWPGYAVEPFPHQCWPSVAVRRVSHLKIVYAAGGGVELKTYLSYFHAFVNHATRKGQHDGLGALGLRNR